MATQCVGESTYVKLKLYGATISGSAKIIGVSALSSLVEYWPILPFEPLKSHAWNLDNGS